MSILKKSLKSILKAFTCNRCKICGEVVELGADLCSECSSLKIIEHPRCVHCGCTKTDCVCKSKKNEFKQITSPYYYSESIVRAISNFKMNDMPFLADEFALKMYEQIKTDYQNIDFDYITFVPLRRFHQAKRGFNQSELIAEKLSVMMNVNSVTLLKKVRYTGVQHKKSAKERAADVFGAFDVQKNYKNALGEKTILLIDDVKTTGATLNECAKMLKIYGAKDVFCASFAVTKKEKSNKNSHI